MGFLSLCDMSLAITHCNCKRTFEGVSMDYLRVLFVPISAQIILEVSALISIVKVL